MTQELPKPRCLPWHEEAVAKLQAAWQVKRMPHALLVVGADGLGKRELAAWLASAVLCERSTETLSSCGECASCKLILAGSHPDLWWVSPEEDKQQISIDQVREACERLSKTSYRQGYKVAVVTPAHAMTIAAANSLLKTLEEPSPQSLLILLSAQPSGLPATIRSRCQQIAVRRPSQESALAWLRSENVADASPALLEFAGGAPLRAIEYANGRFETLDREMQRALRELLAGETDVTQVASAWAKEGLPDRLTWLDLWLTSAARGALAGSADLVTFPPGPMPLPRGTGALNISGLYEVVDRLRALKAQLTRTALQRELALESWLIALLQCLAPAKAQRTSTG